MKTVLASLALFVAAALGANFTINTPSNVVECEPTLITWMGGTPPYYLSILPGATPNGNAIESFPATNSTSITWTVNLEQNQQVGLTCRDSTGLTAQSAPFTIEAGTSSACLSSTSISAGPTAGSTSAGSATTGGSATAASTGATTAGSASASSTSTSKSGASANVAQFGTAGVVGAVVGALLL